MMTEKMNNCTYCFYFRGFYFYPGNLCCSESSPV